MVQSLIIICSNRVNICPVRFPNMCGADDFDRDTKGGEPSKEPGVHCDIQMGKKVLVMWIC